jgi:hypothetical protein
MPRKIDFRLFRLEGERISSTASLLEATVPDIPCLLHSRSILSGIPFRDHTEEPVGAATAARAGIPVAEVAATVGISVVSIKILVV